MGVIDRRRMLLENIVRLRRAERDAPGNRDIAAVRAALEEELGDTVSRRMAADLLGVSHTALAHWIRVGDLPLVHTMDGRAAIPVSSLLDLYEAVTRERASGRGRRHVLESVMAEGRERARETQFRDLVADSDHAFGYRRADLRNLAYHRAVAKRLRRAMVDDALHRVWRWTEQGRLDPRYAQRWEEILQKPVAEVRRVISADDPESHDLRQNSPFAGVLSQPERRKILEEIR